MLKSIKINLGRLPTPRPSLGNAQKKGCFFWDGFPCQLSLKLFRKLSEVGGGNNLRATQPELLATGPFKALRVVLRIDIFTWNGVSKSSFPSDSVRT